MSNFRVHIQAIHLAKDLPQLINNTLNISMQPYWHTVCRYESHRGTAAKGGKRILIVDDHETNRKIQGNTASQWGFSHTEAIDGKCALHTSPTREKESTLMLQR